MHERWRGIGVSGIARLAASARSPRRRAHVCAWCVSWPPRARGMVGVGILRQCLRRAARPSLRWGAHGIVGGEAAARTSMFGRGVVGGRRNSCAAGSRCGDSSVPAHHCLVSCNARSRALTHTHTHTRSHTHTRAHTHIVAAGVAPWCAQQHVRRAIGIARRHHMLAEGARHHGGPMGYSRSV